MPRLLRLFSPPFLAIGLATPASGQFALTEADFFAPMPRVLTASRLDQPLTEVPVAMTVIDRDMIEASSALDVVELLRLVPGFQVARKEGIDTIATYQGFADDFPRSMQVLVDGRSVYDPGLNGVVWSSIPVTPAQIERIEVVRGSNAAAYGSNAVMGTINIITRQPETSDRLQVRALAGSDGVSEGEFSHAGVHGDTAWRIDASRLTDDGFDAKDDSTTSSIVNLQGSYRPTLDDELTVRLGGRETDLESETFGYPRDRMFKSNYQQLAWTRTLPDDDDIQVQFYRRDFRSPDVADVSSEVPGGSVDYTLNSERLDLEMQHRWHPADGWRLSWGAGLRRDTVSGGIFDTDADMRRYQKRAFGNLEWRAANDLVINGGLMAEDYSDLGDYYSPRLAANWLLDDRQTLRTSVARAYRIPTFLERRGQVVLDVGPVEVPILLGDPSLDAVQVDSVELAYLRELSELNGVFEIRLFRFDHDPVIDSADDDNNTKAQEDDVRRFIEAGDFNVRGIEAQLQLRPATGTLLHIAYNYADARGSLTKTINTRNDDIDPPDDPNPPTVNGRPRPNDDKVPRHTLTLLASQALPNDWTLSGTYYHVSDMTWRGEGEAVDSLNRVDAKLSKRLRSSDGDWILSLNVQNLFDESYYEFEPPDLPQRVGNLAERRVQLQAEYLLH
jgi:iron complex outermembrane receptor protein